MPPLTPRRKANKPPRATTGQRGYGYRHQKIRAAFLHLHPVCQRCGGAWARELHHRDRNTSNTSAANLEALCTACHQREHKGASE
jgi:5-methylcytosine-specific restriction protein A